MRDSDSDPTISPPHPGYDVGGPACDPGSTILLNTSFSHRPKPSSAPPRCISRKGFNCRESPLTDLASLRGRVPHHSECLLTTLCSGDARSGRLLLVPTLLRGRSARAPVAARSSTPVTPQWYCPGQVALFYSSVVTQVASPCCTLPLATKPSRGFDRRESPLTDLASLRATSL